MSRSKSQVELAKIAPPKLPRVLERTRLFNELDLLQKAHRVIWVQAPPGAGKTTLVASYLQARKCKPLWYQIDEGDVDPGTWFHYLSLGMKNVAPRYKKPLSSLSPEYLPGIQVFTRRFFEQLYGRLKAPGMLVFDNFQNLGEDERAHDLMNIALSAIPEGVTVFMISRQPPPASFAQIQAEQQLAMVASNTLQLTLSETKEFFRLRRRGFGQKGEHDQAKSVYHLTQGWLAGVVLLLAHDEGEQLMVDSAKTEEYAPVVFDYFASQVFAQQSKDRQDFLVQTAFFSSMTSMMAEQVTGDLNAKSYLARLAGSHYFTEQHGGEAPTYQYHPLFREFLQTYARENLTPVHLRALKLQTAQALDQGGQYEEALKLYRSSEEIGDVVRVILTHAEELFVQGRYQMLEKWLLELPSDVLASEPWLRFWLANCRLLTASQNSKEMFIALITEFEHIGDMDGFLLSWCGVIESITLSLNATENLSVWCDFLSKWLQKEIPIPSVKLEARVTFTMFSALVWSRFGEAEVYEWEARVQKLLEQMPDISYRILVGYHLHTFWTWLGDFEKGKTILTKMEKWRTLGDVSPIGNVRILHMKTVLAWLMGEGTQSMNAYQKARELIEIYGLFNIKLPLYFDGIAAAVLLKDLRYAMEILEELRPVSEQSLGQDGVLFQLKMAWVIGIKGDYPTALGHGRRAVRLLKGAAYHIFLEAFTRWTYLQLLIEAGKFEDVDEQMVCMQRIRQKLNSPVIEFVIALVEAQLAIAQAQHHTALIAIEKVLMISRETGLVFGGGFLPDVLVRICALAFEQNVEIEQARHIVKKLQLLPDVPLHIGDSWPWPVKIYTLGKFVLMSGTGAVEFGRKIPKMPLALLKLLIAFGGAEVSQHRVLDLLWPDADGDNAYRSLKMALSRLRKLLQRDDAILFSGGTLSINSEVCWVDSLNFQHLVKQSEIEDKQGNLAKRDELFERAQALYKGEFLPHDDEAWVLPARKTLQLAYASLMKRLDKHNELQIGQS